MMQMSALGHYKPPMFKSSGFTLLELMVVLIVAGISFALLLPNFMKNEDDQVKEESMRLVALMEYAADYAGTSGQWLALSASTSSYRFMQRDENSGGWQALASDDVLRERQLPEGMTILAINSQQEGTNAMVTLSPTGIQSPFQIELSLGQAKRLVRGNLIGKVEVSTGLEGSAAI
jgi:type II secretion system protein H